VKWATVCKEKIKGGLGVRDVKIVNLSLLTKWRWRLLQEGRSLWNEVLDAKYGSHISFLKLPTKVWKKIVKIQREFLWGGVRGGKKI
jgi:hypothetical protein